MSSYLIPYQPYSINPYNSPLDLYQRALAIKDQKFGQGLANIRSHYDNVLNTPLTNEANQVQLRAGIDDAMNKLSKAAVNDVSLPENQSEINSSFDKILDDSDIMYDAAWTRNHQRQLKKAEDLQKKDPSLVTPQNLEPLFLQQEEFRAAPKGARPRASTFTPFYDFDTKMNVQLDKIKADVDRVFSVSGTKVQGPDGKMYDVNMPSQYTVKQLKDYKIRELVWQKLNSDSQALHQMSLDYNYNQRNGLYPPTASVQGIDAEVNTYKGLAEGLTEAIARGVNLNNQPISENERLNYEERVKSANQQIAQLTGLKNDINTDPSNSNKWFTFDRHIKNYVNGKVNQYSNKEDSLISSVPGVDEFAKYQLDVLKEGWKAQFAQQTAAVAAKAKSKEEAASVAADVPAPYIDVMQRLASSPGGINATNEELQGLGQMSVDAKGNMYMNLLSDNKTPETSLIISPASGSYTNEQIKAIDGNVVLTKLKGELEALGIKGPHGIRVPGVTGKAPGVNPLEPISSGAKLPPSNGPQRSLSGEEILADYSKNPDGADPKIKALVNKYSDVFKRYNIDPTDISQIKELQTALSDPNIQTAVTLGTTVNFNGPTQFIPERGNNLTTGSGQKMQMKGRIVATYDKLKEGMGKDGLAEAIKSGFVVPWSTQVTSGDVDEVVKKQTEATYALSVYIPVNGDVTQINDRLLDIQKFNDQWGSKAPAARMASRQKVADFQNLLGRANSINSDVPLAQGADGNYNVRFNGSSTPRQVEGLNQLVQLGSELSSRTGQSFKDIDQAIKNIYGTYSGNPIKIQMELDNLANIPTAGATSGNFMSYATPEEGRAALENQLELYKTGRTRNNVSPSSTLLEAMSVYAPASDNNNPRAYAERIAKALGVSVNTPISQIDTKRWADVITQVEGNTRGNNPGNLRPTR